MDELILDHTAESETVPLSNATLGQLPPGVETPKYDRSTLTPGIVHIGLGNFHRAHQSWYLHQLMQQGEANDWAIIGAGVRANDASQRDLLAQQDFMTTLIQLDPDGKTAEVVGSMIGFVEVDEANGPLIAQLADESIRIAALTVTEGGYFIDSSTNQFDDTHPDIQYDAKNPQTPKTAFGAIVEALRLRREKGIGPFTCQSCDNLQGNGDVLRRTVLSLARMSNPDLADWIDNNSSFPNAMVDCIVPATGDKERALVKSYGIDDAVPVTHENFRQWVLEDNFCAGRPDWDNAGATFSNDVHSYEVMKLRILNGGHQIVSNLGELLSIDQIDQCLANDVINRFFTRVAVSEIAPTVAAVPDMTPEAYVKLVDSRFSNPEIIDTVRRVAFDGYSRHPAFLFPTIGDALENNAQFDGLALTEALWARMCFGVREDGSQIEPNDPKWDALKRVAQQAKEDPSQWLKQPNLYGSLAENRQFAERFNYWLSAIWEVGTVPAVERYLKGE